MDKYKLGKFVYLYHLNEGYVLFNLINDAVVLLNDEGVNLIKKYENKLHEIRKIHPSLFKSLLNSKFIVAKELDEVERMIAQWREEDCAEYKFTLTVNPTLGCNLRCWYCYEAHEGMSIMGQGVLGRVMKLIENKVGNPKLRGFNLDFFGGEPLLAFAKVVRPLMTYTKDICRKYKKQYYFSFTTNAVLLNAEIIDYLKKSGEYAPVRLQITLDGSEQFHDATRSTVTGSPTYRLILHNISVPLKRDELNN